MIYGKIIDNKICFANENSTNLKVGDKFIWGKANKETLLNMGFKELIPTQKPENKEGFSHYYTWEIVNDEIVCVWHEAEITDEQLA